METKHTTGPLHQGNRINDRTYQPNVLFDSNGDAIAEVYGIPIHSRLEEIQNDPRWQKGLANAGRLCLCWNSHEVLLNALKAISNGPLSQDCPLCHKTTRFSGHPRITNHESDCPVAIADAALQKAEAGQ